MTEPARDGTEGAGASDEAAGDEADPALEDHLEGVEDGAGCTEIWEHLEDARGNPADEAAEDGAADGAPTEADDPGERRADAGED